MYGPVITKWIMILFVLLVILMVFWGNKLSKNPKTGGVGLQQYFGEKDVKNVSKAY
ncbi:hypothetical protein D3C75_708260 [compost metagenome]